MVVIERFCYSPMGTFGNLLIDGKHFSFTMEEIWKDNKPSISCIPEGYYVCKRVNSPKFGNVFEVTKVPKRTSILFHVGNTIHDVEGCICPGSELGALGGIWAVLNSTNTFKLFMDKFHDVDEFSLQVTHKTI